MKPTFTSAINAKNYTQEEAIAVVTDAIEKGYQFSGFWDGSTYRIGVGYPVALTQNPPEDDGSESADEAGQPA